MNAGAFLGCPMWSLKSWIGPFLPTGTKQRDFLREYSRRLNCVEGNTTFYALPDVATVERWRDETPEDFRFCFKVPQRISHELKLINAEQETAALIDRLQHLGMRRGPTFLQLPPSFDAHMLPALRIFLERWPREFSLAVEPRHADFFGPAEAEFEDLLHTHTAARGIFDTTPLFALSPSYSPDVRQAQAAKPRFPLRRSRTAPFTFVRFCGQPDRAATHPWLVDWAAYIVKRLAAGEDCYFFLHTPDDAAAPQLARDFHDLLTPHISLPPLPDFGNPQQSLFG
ncbi:MAG: DUF72 domain-containing protein [Chloroflexi bacterium]|nr:DUF72 domain-containing protein [Chloroflexota bacterium]